VAKDDGRIVVWDVATALEKDAAPARELDSTADLRTLAVSDDGQLLVVGDNHSALTVHRLGEGTHERHPFKWGRIDDLEFVAGSHVVVVAASDGQVHLFDADRGEEIRVFNTHDGRLGSLARSANGKILVIRGSGGSILRLA